MHAVAERRVVEREPRRRYGSFARGRDRGGVRRLLIRPAGESRQAVELVEEAIQVTVAGGRDLRLEGADVIARLAPLDELVGDQVPPVEDVPHRLAHAYR